MPDLVPDPKTRESDEARARYVMVGGFLGAGKTTAIIRLALGRGVVLSILGLALGALAASGLARLTAGFLVGVRPGDPAVFGIAGFLLAGVALLACLVPSRRAAKADPLATLRAG